MAVARTQQARRRARGGLPSSAIMPECFMIADSAEVCNGKVYMLGGGWTHLNAASLPTAHQVALPIVLSVPWSETNQAHSFSVTLSDEDSRPVLPEPLAGTFNVGRPAGAVPGDPL